MKVPSGQTYGDSNSPFDTTVKYINYTLARVTIKSRDICCINTSIYLLLHGYEVKATIWESYFEADKLEHRTAGSDGHQLNIYK